MLKNKEVVGTFLVFLTAIISGFSIFANKIFIAKIDPLIFTALRGIFIGLIFLILSFAYSHWNPKKFKKVSWNYLIAIGIIGGGIAFWMFFSGLKITTAGRSGFIHKTLPIYVLALAVIFLKEKISKKQILATLIMLTGLIILLLTSITPASMWLNPTIGDLLVLGATILWAIEIVIARKAMLKGENNFVVSFARMFFGSLILFAIIIINNKWNIILELNFQQWIYIVTSTIILFFYILTFYWGIRYINVSKAAPILLISPIITLILGAVFLGEPYPAMQLLGSGIIIIGAYFISKEKSRSLNTNLYSN